MSAGPDVKINLAFVRTQPQIVPLFYLNAWRDNRGINCFGSSCNCIRGIDFLAIICPVGSEASATPAHIHVAQTEDVALTTYDFAPVWRSTVGFDCLFESMNNQPAMEGYFRKQSGPLRCEQVQGPL